MSLLHNNIIPHDAINLLFRHAHANKMLPNLCILNCCYNNSPINCLSKFLILIGDKIIFFILNIRYFLATSHIFLVIMHKV